MSRIAIKICGLSTPETLAAAIGAGASHVGFVHFGKSPRHVETDHLASLTRQVPGHVQKVAVVVDPEDMMLEQIIAAGQPDAVQLHGKETPERVAALRTRFPQTRFWKAVSVKTAADIAAADRYRDAADFILFDAKTPDGAQLPGGMGIRFDWKLMQGWNATGPWGLSGGLDPCNAAEAIRITGAPLVDISSGVESAPGIKDVDKITAFCKAVLQC